MKLTKSQLKLIINEEIEQMQLQDLQPQVDAAYDVIQKELEKVPEEIRGIVLQALVAKLAGQSNDDNLEEVSSIEEDG